MTTNPDAEQRDAVRQGKLLTARLALAVHKYDESKLRPEQIQTLNRERVLRSVLRRWR